MIRYRYLAVTLLLALLCILPVSADPTVYNTAGTFSWNSTTNTMVYISIVGGGSSGHGGWAEVGVEHYGLGGHAGNLTNVSGIAVTQNTLYTIVVGAGGARDAAGDVTNVLAPAGSATTAFGYTAAGGTAVYGGTAQGNGTDGVAGYLEMVNPGEAGESVTTYTGGAEAYGLGASGGGGAGNSATNEMGYGGAGMNGGVFIYTQSDSPGNYPNFTASQTTGGAGTNVLFTNNSAINDQVNLTWLWDFGDGSTSTTAGSVSHIYAYYGTYTVSLTLTSDTGIATTTRNEYILISPQEDSLDLKTEPIAVQFHVQTLWGTPLVGANVSIIGITTSTGNWDWIPLLLGIPLDEVALNNTAMWQTADSYGNVEFLMIPTAKYNVTTLLTNYTFQPLYVTPHDTRYTIVADIGTGEWSGVNTTIQQVNVSVSSEKVNDTAGIIYVHYYDAGSQTTGGNISVYSKNATPSGVDVLITQIPIASNDQNSSISVPLSNGFSGETFTVSTAPDRVTAIGTSFQNFQVYFRGKNVELGGLDPTILLWFSLFIIIFTAMFGGASHAPQMSIIVCVEGWIFWTMGWLDPLAGNNTLGQPILVVLMIVATFMAVIWNFREGKRKEKGS
jgi:PKD repeat protein